jgi:transposase
MPRRIKIKPHLSREELKQGYIKTRDPKKKAHYQVILLLTEGEPSFKVAQRTGYSINWIYELVRSYNRHGVKMLGDKRRLNTGRQPLLDDEQQNLLFKALQKAPEEGGLWNGPTVAQWISKLLGRYVSPQRGWEYMKKLEYR